jgi:hypothetical protein
MSAFKSSIVFGNAEERYFLDSSLFFSYESPPQTPPRTQKLHGEDKVNRSQIVFGSEPTELKETPARRQKAFAYVT